MGWSLCSKFQASLGYTVSHCLKNYDTGQDNIKYYVPASDDFEVFLQVEVSLILCLGS